MQCLSLPMDGSPQSRGGQRGVRGVKQSRAEDVTHELEQSGEGCVFDGVSTLTTIEAAERRRNSRQAKHTVASRESKVCATYTPQRY